MTSIGTEARATRRIRNPARGRETPLLVVALRRARGKSRQSASGLHNRARLLGVPELRASSRACSHSSWAFRGHSAPRKSFQAHVYPGQSASRESLSLCLNLLVDVGHLIPHLSCLCVIKASREHG